MWKGSIEAEKLLWSLSKKPRWSWKEIIGFVVSVEAWKFCMEGLINILISSNTGMIISDVDDMKMWQLNY